MALLFLILVTCFLAYSNGANDNFKGVASLFGSGTSRYRRAIWWATATTFTGSITSMVLAQSLRGAGRTAFAAMPRAGHGSAFGGSRPDGAGGLGPHGRA